jgi:hypothetical protein
MPDQCQAWLLLLLLLLLLLVVPTAGWTWRCGINSSMLTTSTPAKTSKPCSPHHNANKVLQGAAQ